MLEGGAQEQLLATRDGTPLRILEADDLKKGAVIEMTGATEVETGPDDPSPTGQRIFIVTRNGEHYLETTAPGEDESRISARIKEAEKDVASAVSRSIHSVIDAITVVDQTLVQLNMAKADTELNEAVAQAILPPARATSSSDPHGSRQGDVEMETMETPSEAPVATVFMQVDTDDGRRRPDDAHPPQYAAEYSATLEEPSMFDTDSATLLSPQVWSVAEKNLESMTAAELEDIKRKTCAEEWRNMVELHQEALP